ncbi:ATP-dependent helicase [Methanophagales archaeon]|nr:MAG: ATP-dependent helicase [Methanophagales archaeon]
MRTAREYKEKEIYERLEPYIGAWFRKKYHHFTPPQRYAIVEIMNRNNILICAPTGSGKTFACFLGIINYLCKLCSANKLEDRIYCLFISPLKALGNDIRRNLEEPLDEIAKIAKEKEGVDTGIRVAVRTGDTTQKERQSMLRKPPHILITTPESAAIILNAPKFRLHLKKLDYVIVDEIHEIADSKRGAHLSITLERLQNFCSSEFTRIGMSATISPLEEVAKFLVGYSESEGEGEGLEQRDCLIADVSFAKELELSVIVPLNFIFVQSDVAKQDTDTTAALYEKVKELVEKHESTLIFTNTRSGAERVSYKLAKMVGEVDKDKIGTHHGSLSRETRFAVEEGLKEGKMKAVACSSSLELGIDIGALDLCVLIGSPKSTTRLIQRAGRSGHRLEKTAKGYLVVTDMDDLVECAVLARRAKDKKLDKVRVVGCALDVLAQHLVGMSLEQKWNVVDAYNLIRRAYPYRDLKHDQLVSVLRYLSGMHSELENRKVYAKIWYDEEEGVFGRKRSTRGIYMTHVGTIPSESSVQVFLRAPRPKEWIGEIDEPFLEKLAPGDTFVLGGKTYKFVSVRGMRAYVDPFDGMPTIPAWIGEMLPLEYDSAIEIGKFREEIEKKIEERSEEKREIVDWLKKEYRLEETAAENVFAYFEEQKRYARVIPNHRRIVIEHYCDDIGRQNIAFHALYGRRTLDALSRAYAYAISIAYKTNVSITINDNGFILKLPHKNVDVESVAGLVNSDNIEEMLRKSVWKTELFKRRFRHCAVRGLMVLKQYKGYEIGVGKQQRSSASILGVAKKIENFPIVEEAFREILEEVFDIEHAKEVLRGVESGAIEIRTIKTPVPSPFIHNLVALQASDVVLMESRRELLQELHRRVMAYIEET